MNKSVERDCETKKSGSSAKNRIKSSNFVLLSKCFAPFDFVIMYIYE